MELNLKNRIDPKVVSDCLNPLELDGYAESIDECVMEAVAGNSMTGTAALDLVTRNAIKHTKNCKAVLLALVKNTGTSSASLSDICDKALSGTGLNNYNVVLIELANNPKTPPESILKMADSPNAIISREAKAAMERRNIKDGRLAAKMQPLQARSNSQQPPAIERKGNRL